MILLAGVTGSGKTTTIASMLDWINHNYRKHILTLEDPIEFAFTDDKCLINQREIGHGREGLHDRHEARRPRRPRRDAGGRNARPRDLRDGHPGGRDGHLVFGTIHASTAASTIGRILDLFPESMHDAFRSAMVFNMKAIIAQKLLPSIKAGVGRVPTCEIMTFTPTVRKLILEGQDEKAGRRHPHRLATKACRTSP